MPTRAPMFQRPFSILNRIDIPATAGDRSAWIEEWQLSVSSTGSISLQRSDEYAIYLPGCSFQYPQPYRYPCTLADRRVVQVDQLKPFSILNRIDIPATASEVLVPLCSSHLSVSSTGSISLQLRLLVGHRIWTGRFQYPQPDRYPCNTYTYSQSRTSLELSVSSTGSISLQPHPHIGRNYTRKSFSILNRIDIPATASHP